MTLNLCVGFASCTQLQSSDITSFKYTRTIFLNKNIYMRLFLLNSDDANSNGYTHHTNVPLIRPYGIYLGSVESFVK